MTLNSEALLPCPFCGNDDIHMSDLNDEDDRRMWVREIECDICQLKMRDWTGWPGKGEPFDRQKMSDAVGAALAKQWNRRATPSPASGELASLVERLNGEANAFELAAERGSNDTAEFDIGTAALLRLAASQLAAVAAERDALAIKLERKQDLLDSIISFVHRWTWVKEGNGTSDAERLDVLKHYPPIAMRSTLSPGGSNGQG